MTGIVGARVQQIDDDAAVPLTGTITAIMARDDDGAPEWVRVQWDGSLFGPAREAFDMLRLAGSGQPLGLPQKWSAEARQLADRLESRITDPRFGGDRTEHSDMRAGYALACGHAAELIRQLAADLEGAGE